VFDAAVLFQHFKAAAAAPGRDASTRYYVLREDLGPETAALICRLSQKEPARFWSLQQKLTPQILRAAR
jgi:hypothetical protein